MEWMQVLTIMIANFAMFLWVRWEGNADRREIRALTDSIQSEMKDFHGRLERQDAEFKAKLLSIEERVRKEPKSGKTQTG